jgi:hypothetical protein
MWRGSARVSRARFGVSPKPLPNQPTLALNFPCQIPTSTAASRSSSFRWKAARVHHPSCDYWRFDPWPRCFTRAQVPSAVHHPIRPLQSTQKPREIPRRERSKFKRTRNALMIMFRNIYGPDCVLSRADQREINNFPQSLRLNPTTLPKTLAIPTWCQLFAIINAAQLSWQIRCKAGIVVRTAKNPRGT